MASSHGSMFEETQVSLAVTEESALEFYEEHGIFYQANAEIGRLRDEIRGRTQREKLFDAVKPIVLKDPRLRQIVEPFLNDPPSFSYIFGPNPGNFFALTKEDHQDDRICLYVWGNETVFEFCPKSHIGEVIGVPAANKLFHIPWPFLKEMRKLDDVKVVMKEGGIAIVHPRLSISGVEGLAPVYACDRKKTEP